MEYDWQFSQKSKCSDSEKRQCMRLVADLVNLSKMARRNGLLSLIQVAEQSSSFLLSKGLQLVVDGVNPQVVRDVLKSYIISGDYEGKELLRRCIILEGVSAIQQGLHPKITKEYLLSFLGEDNYDAYQQEYEGDIQNALESYLQSIKDSPSGSPKGAKLDRLIANLDNDCMEKFLMEINTGDLARSLKGMGGQAQIRIFKNLPRKAAHALKDTMDDLDSMDDAELSRIQDIVIDIISDFQTPSANTVFN